MQMKQKMLNIIFTHKLQMSKGLTCCVWPRCRKRSFGSVICGPCVGNRLNRGNMNGAPHSGLTWAESFFSHLVDLKLTGCFVVCIYIFGCICFTCSQHQWERSQILSLAGGMELRPARGVDVMEQLVLALPAFVVLTENVIVAIMLLLKLQLIDFISPSVATINHNKDCNQSS